MNETCETCRFSDFYEYGKPYKPGEGCRSCHRNPPVSGGMDDNDYPYNLPSPPVSDSDGCGKYRADLDKVEAVLRTEIRAAIIAELGTGDG